jgi:hypothetical protein
MIKYACEQLFLSANELVDSIAKTDSKAYWSLIKKLTKGSNNNYSIPPLFDNNLNDLVYTDKEKANLLNE